MRSGAFIQTVNELVDTVFRPTDLTAGVHVRGSVLQVHWTSPRAERRRFVFNVVYHPPPDAYFTVTSEKGNMVLQLSQAVDGAWALEVENLYLTRPRHTSEPTYDEMIPLFQTPSTTSLYNVSYRSNGIASTPLHVVSGSAGTYARALGTGQEAYDPEIVRIAEIAARLDQSRLAPVTELYKDEHLLQDLKIRFRAIHDYGLAHSLIIRGNGISDRLSRIQDAPTVDKVARILDHYRRRTSDKRERIPVSGHPTWTGAGSRKRAQKHPTYKPG